MHKLISALIMTGVIAAIGCGKKLKNTQTTRTPNAFTAETAKISTSTDQIGLLTFEKATEATVPAELHLKQGTIQNERVRVYFDFVSKDDFAYHCEYIYNEDNSIFTFHKCYLDEENTITYSSYPGYPEYIYPSKSLAVEVITTSNNQISVEATVELNNL